MQVAESRQFGCSLSLAKTNCTHAASAKHLSAHAAALATSWNCCLYEPLQMFLASPVSGSPKQDSGSAGEPSALAGAGTRSSSSTNLATIWGAASSGPALRP